MADRNKIYITLAAAIPGTLGNGNNRVVAFNATQTTSGTVAADAFGNFLRVFQAMSSGDPADLRAKKRVTAWFNESPVVGTAPGSQSGAHASVDFIAATGVATTLPGINPILTRHFRVRAIINRWITAAEFPRSTLTGTIFVQRQHSFEA